MRAWILALLVGLAAVPAPAFADDTASLHSLVALQQAEIEQLKEQVAQLAKATEEANDAAKKAKDAVTTTQNTCAKQSDLQTVQALATAANGKYCVLKANPYHVDACPAGSTMRGAFWGTTSAMSLTTGGPASGQGDHVDLCCY